MSDGLPPGLLIGERFRLLAPLGQEAGSVWSAVDERTGASVAIRLRRGRPGPDPAARVVHPHVVSIFSFGTHEGAGFSVMELVDGVSLATILDDGQVPEDEGWRIAAEVCQALHAAHSVGVAHGDLKPGNVLIAETGMVKVGGFTGTGGARQDMYSVGLLMEAMSGSRDPIVKRLLSRDPYSPAQLHEILTGSTLDEPAGEFDDEDAERPRLVRLAVISGTVTLAIVVAACAWLLAPIAPPEFDSQGTSAGLPGSPPPQPSSAAAAPTSRPPAAPSNTGIDRVKAVIADQLKAGQIQPDAASSLNARLDDIARFQSRGLTKQANDRIDSFKSQLTALRQNNKVTAQGYEAILASLNKFYP